MAGDRHKLMRLVLTSLLACAISSVAHAEFTNPGQYGGFVPPHELEQLQNIDPDNTEAGQKEFDPYFSVENDPWEKLPSPFEEVPAEIQEMREDAQQMREEAQRRAQRFISERELQMLENPGMGMGFRPPMQPGVWGDLGRDGRQTPPPPAGGMPPAQQGAYPYQGYAPPPAPWQPRAPGISPGYSPGFGSGPGYNTSPYIYPAMPGPGMMNNIAPFIY